MMNPIARALLDSGYSTTALAKKLCISRQYVSRLCQGLYDRPNKKILEWASEILSQDPKEIEREYRIWQNEKRADAIERFNLEPLRQNKAGISSVQFRDWREEYWNSSHAFCVDMCLHPSPVADFEDGTVNSMPMSLKTVLTRLELI